MSLIIGPVTFLTLMSWTAVWDDDALVLPAAVAEAVVVKVEVPGSDRD